MTIRESIDYLADYHCEHCTLCQEGKCTNEDQKCFAARAVAIDALYLLLHIKSVTKDIEV